MAETAGDGFVWREVGETAVDAIGYSPLSYGMGALAIIVVSGIAVATIIFSARWAIRSMIKSASDAVAMVDRGPAEALSQVSTIGIGRMMANPVLQTFDFQPSPSSLAGTITEDSLLRSVEASNIQAWILPDDFRSDPNAISLVLDKTTLATARQAALAVGFVCDGTGRFLTLRQAERIAEREAMDDAIRGLSVIQFALGTPGTSLDSYIGGMDVETVALPPVGGPGEVVKRVTVRWTLETAKAAA